MYNMKTHSWFHSVNKSKKSNVKSFGGVRGSPIFNMQEKKSHEFHVGITLKGCKTMRCLKVCVCVFVFVCVCVSVCVFRGFYKQLFFL